jgi:hypothetical protein
MTANDTRCPWCNKHFMPRRGGSPQVFCSSAHRAAFHSAARRWAEHAVAVGMLAVADLKANLTACTLRLRSHIDLERERDLADVGGEAGAATHAVNITRSAGEPGSGW